MASIMAWYPHVDPGVALIGEYGLKGGKGQGGRIGAEGQGAAS